MGKCTSMFWQVGFPHLKKNIAVQFGSMLLDNVEDAFTSLEAVVHGHFKGSAFVEKTIEIKHRIQSLLL